jgi:hypothetical protein
MGVTEPKTTSRQLDRWSPLTGIGFAVLFVVSAVLFDGQPSPGASDAEIRGYYADDGNQLRLESAFFIATISGVLFMCFAAVLSSRMRAAEGPREWLSLIPLVSGGAFVALHVAAAAVNQFVADAADDNPDQFEIDTDTARVLTNGAYSLSPEAALPLVAPLVAATSVVFLRTLLLPRWLGWAGVVVAFGCLLGFLGVTTGLFLVWVGVVAALLVMRGATARR